MAHVDEPSQHIIVYALVSLWQSSLVLQLPTVITETETITMMIVVLPVLMVIVPLVLVNVIRIMAVMHVIAQLMSMGIHVMVMDIAQTHCAIVGLDITEAVVNVPQIHHRLYAVVVGIAVIRDATVIQDIMALIVLSLPPVVAVPVCLGIVSMMCAIVGQDIMESNVNVPQIHHGLHAVVRGHAVLQDVTVMQDMLDLIVRGVLLIVAKPVCMGIVPHTMRYAIATQDTTLVIIVNVHQILHQNLAVGLVLVEFQVVNVIQGILDWIVINNCNLMKFILHLMIVNSHYKP